MLIWIAAAALIIATPIGVTAVAETWPKVWLYNATTYGKLSSRIFTQTFWIENTSTGSLAIRRVDSGAPGVTMIGSDFEHALTLPRHGKLRIVTTYQITDCRVPIETVPLQLRTDQWWGTLTITVQDHGSDFPGAEVACADV